MLEGKGKEKKNWLVKKGTRDSSHEQEMHVQASADQSGSGK
jgi:hypothetical protein